VILLLRSLFFTILLPGTVTVLIPGRIVSREGLLPLRVVSPWQYLALVPVAVGTAILARCIWEFASRGRGTLAPIDPPRRLVVTGLYRYVRNPMYVGVLTVLLGEAALFRSVDLLEYAAVFFVIVNLFVLLYEEPALRRRFGESYEHYRRAVRRWVPGRPYPPP
jgi:protein-S-isoprenylcysteine O-methyltransferase Ste14